MNKYRGNFDVVVGYCHDSTCSEFGLGQQLAVSKDTFYEPSSWIDDPECRVCLGELKADKPNLSGQPQEEDYGYKFYEYYEFPDDDY